MIETKLYLYDSAKTDYKGLDLSKYVLEGNSSTDTLNEELDTFRLVLAGYPNRKEFEPTTKFILEKWQDGEMVREFDLVVNTDAVEQPVMANEHYFNHNIDFYEASALAQGRIVDNISVTYKLKDVKLTDEVIPDPDTHAIYSENAILHNQDYKELLNKYSIKIETNQFLPNFKKYFFKQTLEFYWAWGSKEDYDAWKNYPYSTIISGESKTITLPLPELRMRIEDTPLNDVTPRYKNVGECSYVIEVWEKDIATDRNTRILKTVKNANETGKWKLDYGNIVEPLPSGYIINKLDIVNSTTELGEQSFAAFKYKQLAYFQTNPITSMSFEALPNKEYEIRLFLANFTEGTHTPYDNGNVAFYNDIQIDASEDRHYGQGHAEFKKDNRRLVGNLLGLNLNFVAYKQGSTQWFLRSAPPANAYDLFQKCQICSQEYFKKKGEFVQDMVVPFYVSPEDKALLQRTTIIESFYHQKNFWEILLEIGKYIHSIPKVRFGKDDRMLVEWNRLGRTDTVVSQGHAVNILNSKSMENYVSACSSYISNAVQIGGTITEYVAPKTSDELFTVYNDTADIHVSKPIIEIVNMEAILVHPRDNYTTDGTTRLPKGAVATLTGESGYTYGSQNPNGYIFAKEIYDLLAVSEKAEPGTQLNPLTLNKGRAIYYEQGSNIISGLTYRLPSKNKGDLNNQYAIKRILQLAFDLDLTDWWDKIYVNDFVFKITYRTKDSLRVEQSRPDLRHYLLNSKYDEVPQHKQFNNQEDIVIDSEALGTKIYGKLIRTGNSEYSVTEWVDDLNDIRKIGDVNRIDGQWYYIAKVTTAYYNNHAICEVKLTKDYNQLSEIIGIPSEPRFYEISEQSRINRDVCFNSFLKLTTDPTVHEGKYHFSGNGKELLFDRIFGQSNGREGVQAIAVTIFKNDINRDYGDDTKFMKPIISPVNMYILHNTLSFEWDMFDNFSAGDKVIDGEPISGVKTVDNAYKVLLPVGYKDTYGRADMVDFAICSQKYLDEHITDGTIAMLPETDNVDGVLGGYYLLNTYFSSVKDFNDVKSNEHGVAVLLDNREVFKGNYNIQMLTDSDRFVISGFLWKEKAYPTQHRRYYTDDIIFSDTRPTPEDLTSKYEIQHSGNPPMNGSTIGWRDTSLSFELTYYFVYDGTKWGEPQINTNPYVKFALLRDEVNKVSNNVIPTSSIIKEYFMPEVVSFSPTKNLEIDIEKILEMAKISDEELLNIKAFAITCTRGVENDNIANPQQRYFVFARNLDGLSNAEKRQNWYIADVDKTFFQNQ